MKKKTLKLISILTIILCIIMTTSICLADIEINNLTGVDNLDTGELSEFANTIITIIRNVGIVLAVIMLMVIGVKYMLGSAEEKAEYKKTMMPYLVGAVLLFMAGTIAGFVKTALT